MECRSLFLLGCCLMLFIQENHAATRVDARQRAEGTVSRRRFISERLLKRGTSQGYEINPKTARQLFRLKGEETLQATDHIHSVQGTDVWRFREEYKGLEVFEAGVTAETDTSGQFTGEAMGTFIENIEDDLPTIEAGITEDYAFHLCLIAAGIEVYEDTIPKFSAELIVHLDHSNTARLTYFIDSLLETNGLRQRPNCLIDAMNGLVFRIWDAMESVYVRFDGVGGNNKSGKILYDEYHKHVSVKQEGGVCYLENEHIKIVNLNFSYALNITETYSFDCDKFDDEINGGYAPALDAFYYANMVYKMFTTWYSIPPLDLPKIVLRVHFGNGVDSAFWDGIAVTLGDGKEKFYPLTDLDVIAHEVGHGFTGDHSGLLYFDQSGGLNEAFADMTGEIAEHFLQTNNFWMIGENIAKSTTAYRYFEDPTLDNVSISHVSNYSDGMNVHYSSGIFNHIFYRIGDVGLLSIKDVYRMFLLANRMYWHHLSTFEGAACDLLKSAYDLGFDLGIVQAAIRSVGLTGCDVTKHMRSLTRNVSIDEITVSNVSSPVFAFWVPMWAGNLTVVGKAEGDGELVMFVHNQTFGDPRDYLWRSGWDMDRAYLIIDSPPPGKLLLKLVTENNDYLENISIRVDYDCVARESWFDISGYIHDCED